MTVLQIHMKKIPDMTHMKMNRGINKKNVATSYTETQPYFHPN